MRRTLLSLAALSLVLAGSSGCAIEINGGAPPSAGGATQPADTPETDPPRTGTPPPDDGSGATGTAPPTTPAPVEEEVAALTCGGLESAQLGSATVRYNGYADPIPLSAGRWTDGDGAVVALQPPCAIGDLTGDGAADALRAVMLDGGGTGRFWGVALWRNDSGAPVFVTVADLGDRTPVERITIGAGRATVVYLTRIEHSAMVETTVERTATYRLTGTTLVETGRVDVPRT